MRINVKEKSRRLETISVHDRLLFRNREETVRGTFPFLDTIRTVKNTDKDYRKFPFKLEYVLYRGNKITPKSRGEVYHSRKKDRNGLLQ